MSMNVTETYEMVERHFDELHERYPESKVELANMFTLSEALLILCMCSKLTFIPSLYDQQTLFGIYLDSTDSRNVYLALRKLLRKYKQLSKPQAYAVLVMASECLSFPENNMIEPRLLLELRVKYVFGIEESTSA